jgi:hypothetical protein
MAAATEIIYPQYRRYLNGRSWFKISSPAEMEEVQQIGSRYVLHTLNATILPDRNHIYDLTFGYAEYATVISAAEYAEARKLVNA